MKNILQIITLCILFIINISSHSLAQEANITEPVHTQNDTANNKQWKVYSKTKDSIIFKYTVRVEDAYEYFSKSKPKCCNGGWIYCTYIDSALVTFYPKGKAIVNKAHTRSTFELSCPYEIQWEINRKKGTVTFNDDLFIYPPAISQLKHLIENK